MKDPLRCSNNSWPITNSSVWPSNYRLILRQLISDFSGLNLTKPGEVFRHIFNSEVCANTFSDEQLRAHGSSVILKYSQHN